MPKEYALNTTATYAGPCGPLQYRGQEGNCKRLQHPAPADEGTTSALSTDSIQKDPREFAWCDPELPEVIRLPRHRIPSARGEPTVHLRHLHCGDSHVKMEVCRVGGIEHLVDLSDHGLGQVQQNAYGAIRDLVLASLQMKRK